MENFFSFDDLLNDQQQKSTSYLNRGDKGGIFENCRLSRRPEVIDGGIAKIEWSIAQETEHSDLLIGVETLSPYLGDDMARNKRSIKNTTGILMQVVRAFKANQFLAAANVITACIDRGLMIEDKDDDGNPTAILRAKVDEEGVVTETKELAPTFADAILKLSKSKETMKKLMEAAKGKGYNGQLTFLQTARMVGEACWAAQKAQPKHRVAWKVVLNKKDYFTTPMWADNIYVLGMDEDWQRGIKVTSKDKIEPEEYEPQGSSAGDGDGFPEGDLELSGSDLDVPEDDIDFDELGF